MEEKELLEIQARYRRRWEQYGHDPRTLGWNKGRQKIRYAAALEHLSPHEYASVLDVGCGFGDLFGYLTAHGWKGQYVGIDVVPELIREAKKKFNDKNACFYLQDIERQPLNEKTALGVAVGLFNWKLRQENMTFICSLLEKMWDATTEVVVLDFLSSCAEQQYPDHFYADPATIFNLARRFSRRILLFHSYMPFEFQIKIWHNDTFSVSYPVFSAYQVKVT